LSVDESLGSLWAVRSLHAWGYEAWIAVSRPNTYAERSRAAAGAVHVRDAMADVEGHARDLAAAAETLPVAAVLPGTEASLRSVTGRERLFPPRVKVGTAPAEAHERATDKRRLAGPARDAGLEERAEPLAFNEEVDVGLGVHRPELVDEPTQELAQGTAGAWHIHR